MYVIAGNTVETGIYIFEVAGTVFTSGEESWRLIRLMVSIFPSAINMTNRNPRNVFVICFVLLLQRGGRPYVRVLPPDERSTGGRLINNNTLSVGWVYESDDRFQNDIQVIVVFTCLVILLPYCFADL